MSYSEEEIEEFKVEAQELLDVAEKGLLSLADGADFKSCFDAIFRAFHNLKGGAGMMEFKELQSHTHELETIFMGFKSKDLIPQEYIQLFLRGTDAARLILDGEKINFDFTVIEHKEEKEIVVESELAASLPDSSVDEFILECEETIEVISRKIQRIENNEYDKELLDKLYRSVHSLKGSAYLFSFKKLGDIAHAMESSLEKIRNETHYPSKLLIDCLFKSLKVTESLLHKIKRKESDEDFSKLIPVVARALEHASSKLERIEVKIAPEIQATKIIPPPKIEKDTESSTSIRVPINLLDSLMNLMGEMVLVRNQVIQYSNNVEDLELASMSKRLNVVTSEIQEEMMKTRMQPIGTVLDKFNRVVRDLSRDLNKSINIVIEGSETELDKSLLEAIKDPLTHIVRNSCDHGIEIADVRKKNGKPESGLITIKSYHEGGQVIVEVSDDGKGLHREQLTQRAIEKGLIDSLAASKMSDKEVWNLIFAPGFSTASQVTNVSGRGVGMDVVRTNIEKLGGTVELSGRPNFGTNIKIKVPLTLAIIPALIVKSGDNKFSIPQVKVEELVRVESSSKNKIEILHGAPVYHLRGNILPLVDLNKMLAEKINEKESLYHDGITIVILNGDGFSFGVIVDDVIDTFDIVVKPINRLLKTLQIYSGATVLGDGSISLILDVMGISKVAQLSTKKNVIKNMEEEKISIEQDLLLFKLNSPTKHAIALNYVQRIEEFSPSDIEYSGNEKVIRYRGNVLNLISGNQELGYEQDIQLMEKINVIVIEKADQLYGIEVNEIIDTFKTDVEIKEVSSKHRGIFGHLLTPDELIVIVDPFEVISKEVMDVVPIKLNLNKIANGTVLLVEDTVYFRRAIQSILEKRGYQVLIAQNGNEALEILKKSHNTVDFIVSDIEMPKMNGFELAKKIKNNPQYAKIPMLALSSKADHKHRTEGLAAGFDMYLEKLRPDVLLAAIAELWNKEKDIA